MLNTQTFSIMEHICTNERERELDKFLFALFTGDIKHTLKFAMYLPWIWLMSWAIIYFMFIYSFCDIWWNDIILKKPMKSCVHWLLEITCKYNQSWICLLLSELCHYPFIVHIKWGMLCFWCNLVSRKQYAV